MALRSGYAVADETRASPLSEQEAVSRALGRAALVEVIEAQVEIQEGQRRVLSAYPNPEIAYMREQTFGVSGTREDYLSLSQTIDLGNRRGGGMLPRPPRARSVRKPSVNDTILQRRRGCDSIRCCTSKSASGRWRAGRRVSTKPC